MRCWFGPYVWSPTTSSPCRLSSASGRPGSSSEALPDIGQLSGSARRSTSVTQPRRVAVEHLPARDGVVPARVGAAHQAVGDRGAHALGGAADRERVDERALQLGHDVLAVGRERVAAQALDVGLRLLAGLRHEQRRLRDP